MGSDDEAIRQQEVQRDTRNQGERRGPARLGSDGARGTQFTCEVPWPSAEMFSGNNSVAIDVVENSWRSEETLRGLTSLGEGAVITVRLLYESTCTMILLISLRDRDFIVAPVTSPPLPVVTVTPSEPRTVFFGVPSTFVSATSLLEKSYV